MVGFYFNDNKLYTLRVTENSQLLVYETCGQVGYVDHHDGDEEVSGFISFS